MHLLSFRAKAHPPVHIYRPLAEAWVTARLDPPDTKTQCVELFITSEPGHVHGCPDLTADLPLALHRVQARPGLSRAVFSTSVSKSPAESSSEPRSAFRFVAARTVPETDGSVRMLDRHRLDRPDPYCTLLTRPSRSRHRWLALLGRVSPYGCDMRCPAVSVLPWCTAIDL
jgi:hypothetical protein